MHEPTLLLILKKVISEKSNLQHKQGTKHLRRWNRLFRQLNLMEWLLIVVCGTTWNFFFHLRFYIENYLSCGEFRKNEFDRFVAGGRKTPAAPN